MSLSSLSMNYGNFVWWKGIIVDIDHPEDEKFDGPLKGKAGRVRVRIFGYHDKDEENIKDEDLPWAMVALPTTSASMSGEGETHGLLKGSWVIGFFLDGDSGQVPIVLFSISGIAHGDASEWDIYKDEPDVNRLARHHHKLPEHKTAIEYRTKVKNHVGSVKTNTRTNSVPDPIINDDEYTNKVFSRHGLSIELDGHTKNPRISVYHRSGSYMEFLPDGSLIVRVLGNKYEIIDGDHVIKSRNMYINSGLIDILLSTGYHLKTKYYKLYSDFGELLMNAGQVILKSYKNLLLIGSKVFIN